jgi:regulator of replication initiation timing
MILHATETQWELKGHDMKRTPCGCIVAVATLVIVATLLTGCQQNDGDKRARLLAAENMELKDRLAGQQTRMQTLEQQHVQELGQQGQELTQCKQRVEQLQKDVAQGVAERAGDVAAKLMDENAKLRKEIEDLRADLTKAREQQNKPPGEPAPAQPR